MKASRINEALGSLSRKSASSMVAHGKIASSALNTTLLHRLSAPPGEEGSFLTDPVFEIAQSWEQANSTFGDLSGKLLHPKLVSSLSEATYAPMPIERHPWSHQLASWEATSKGYSCLVSSGTGSGKTECFIIPILNDLLRQSGRGLLAGVRAIIIYPLNALIESQRERLAAWTAPMKGQLRFALYNGLTPETPREEKRGSLAAAELGNRRAIRQTPPAILVTNITMLEYMLLRSHDRTILEQSKGLLRWIVLDEAHSYIGAQAAEMALLLRRVRAGFGVEPEQIRLILTSATVGEGSRAEARLKRFTAYLAGTAMDRVQVIQGRETRPDLPPPTQDIALDVAGLRTLAPGAAWDALESHPRMQMLIQQLSEKRLTLSEIATILFGSSDRTSRDDAQAVLDVAAQARSPVTDDRLLPWRAHIFHRAQGGLWTCVDPDCGYRDPQLRDDGSDWEFGAIWLKQRDRCACGAPVFELFACNECGAPHLAVGIRPGKQTQLVPPDPIEVDEFALDAEPEDGDDTESTGENLEGLISGGQGGDLDCFLSLDDGMVFDNAPPADRRWVRVVLNQYVNDRNCCPGAERARLSPQRYSSPFFMGVALPAVIPLLAKPFDEPGRPFGGRRALTFSDSRQGTARLAAKLQQDAERNLTRAFLYHSVQEDRGPDPARRAKLEEQLAKIPNIPELEEVRRNIKVELRGHDGSIKWKEIAQRFAKQEDLLQHATRVWRERRGGGDDLADNPSKLAEMFLMRELFRRPKVQNNAETMGLVCLKFPRLDSAAARLSQNLAGTGIRPATLKGLAYAAIDFVFRSNLAVWTPDERMLRFISPRTTSGTRSICTSDLKPSDRPGNARGWPGAMPAPGKPTHLHRLVYAVIGGDSENKGDQDIATEIFSYLWSLIARTAARDIGGGVYQLDFRNAAVERVERGWLCPVTRRIFGYSPAGLSPYDPDRRLMPISLPRLPRANPGGLDPASRREIETWCEENKQIAKLRSAGIWTNLHDRVASYAPFLRAQEHTAQIEREVLADYEQMFKDGKINLLNCSTTMEMGIDIPDVQLVANANVPPSITNYRQRLGRAGRRGEPWAFGLTFCRDLPLDRNAFDQPGRFLSAPVSVPAVRLDSPGLVFRHVHAAVLGGFLRTLPDGFELRSTVGAFLGATDDPKDSLSQDSVVNDLLRYLGSDEIHDSPVARDLQVLVRGTALDGTETAHLIGATAKAIEGLLRRWRDEYTQLLIRSAAATESEVRSAFESRARRMKGEFLLGELARRGVTPAYGFPVDVVAFDHLSGHDRKGRSRTEFSFRRGGASRTLDLAIREYAPGNEVVIDGLVHRSEGVLPAWKAGADDSRLEDLQFLWECGSCRSFGLARSIPEACPQCSTPNPTNRRTLRPAGFLGRRAPHTGYENLGHVPYEMPRLSAARGSWLVMADRAAGRWRTDNQGQIVTCSSGPHGKGYALCLDCGRAVAETEDASAPLPDAIRKHRPLARPPGNALRLGNCSGGFVRPERIQRGVRLIHAMRTDVFELQLPRNSRRGSGLALAAGLREALAGKLGAEAREIGVSVDHSKGPAIERRISAFVFDRASGGAGYASRLADMEWLVDCLTQARERLDCQEGCRHGCPACILRPDLNFERERLDREGGRVLANRLQGSLKLRPDMRVFGPDTQLLGMSMADWLDKASRSDELVSVDIYLHGAPSDWELAEWPVMQLLGHMKDCGVNLSTVMDRQALTDRGLNLAQKLDLHRLTAHTSLACTHALPFTAETPILAAVTDRQGRVTAIAVQNPVEAMPGAKWGLGESTALLCGRLLALPATTAFPSKGLLRVSSGNAWLIRVGARLNGRVGTFGRAFWQLVTTEAPMALATIKEIGCTHVDYSDRYLRSPLSLRLLYEVIRHMPGRRGRSKLRITTAAMFSSLEEGWTILHNFPEE